MAHKRIQLVVGTRPEMVQALPLVRAGLAARDAGIDFQLVAVSQHTDPVMSSEVLPPSLTSSWPIQYVDAQPFSLSTAIARTLQHFEETRPDVLIVIGDTDTSLGAALAATELRIPVAHVESGLRSFDWAMKEERNRVLIDHLSALVFPPTEAAERRLHEERVHAAILRTGDVHVDAFRILREEGLVTKRDQQGRTEPFVLSTIHRRENILEEGPLRRIVTLLNSLPIAVRLALHPHTRLRLQHFGLMDELVGHGRVTVTEPLAFLDFVRALDQSSGVVTDSGGVQKQAWLMDKPCITLRTSTEWVETLHDGWNRLVDPATVTRLDAPAVDQTAGPKEEPFGDGFAAERIIDATRSLAQ